MLSLFKSYPGSLEPIYIRTRITLNLLGSTRSTLNAPARLVTTATRTKHKKRPQSPSTRTSPKKAEKNISALENIFFPSAGTNLQSELSDPFAEEGDREWKEVTAFPFKSRRKHLYMQIRG
jgi:hypothetical protein